MCGPNQQGRVRRLLERHSAIFRLVAQSLPASDNVTAGFGARFAPAVDLFSGILSRLQETCGRGSVPLEVVLLPGRSLVEEPRTVSALYQDHLRRRVA